MRPGRVTVRPHPQRNGRFQGPWAPRSHVVENPKSAQNKKKYQKPEIIHVEKIEARAVACAKMVGDDFCETNAPTTS